MAGAVADNGTGVEIDFTSDAGFVGVIETALAGDQTVNLILDVPNQGGADYFRFDDRTGDDPSFELFIDYDIITIPEPSTAILAGLGLMGVCFRRRRRK